jgi:hypothetical protein
MNQNSSVAPDQPRPFTHQFVFWSVLSALPFMVFIGFLLRLAKAFIPILESKPVQRILLYGLLIVFVRLLSRISSRFPLLPERTTAELKKGIIKLRWLCVVLWILAIAAIAFDVSSKTQTSAPTVRQLSTSPVIQSH